MKMGRIKEQILKGIPKSETEFRLQELSDSEDKNNSRHKALSSGRCVYCDKPLSKSEFRDKEGELEGWITECLYCDVVYDED
jgi:hypothetical protein